MRKLRTQANIAKKRSNKVGHDYMSLSIEDDYYATADHLSYSDLGDLLDRSEAYAGSYN
jgi:hypothetical protein